MKPIMPFDIDNELKEILITLLTPYNQKYRNIAKICYNIINIQSISETVGE